VHRLGVSCISCHARVNLTVDRAVGYLYAYRYPTARFTMRLTLADLTGNARDPQPVHTVSNKMNVLRW